MFENGPDRLNLSAVGIRSLIESGEVVLECVETHLERIGALLEFVEVPLESIEVGIEFVGVRLKGVDTPLESVGVALEFVGRSPYGIYGCPDARAGYIS